MNNIEAGRVTSKNRGGVIQYPGIDILKISLSYLVVLRHCAQSFLPSDTLMFQLIVKWLSVLAVPTFFSASAFLLYVRKTNICKQIFRILKLYIVWTIIYFPISAWRIISSDDITISLLKWVQESVFSGSYFHLCFLPALVAGTIIFTGLKKYLKKDFIVLGVCCILFFIGIFGDSWKSAIYGTVFETILYRYQTAFITTRNGLFFAPIFIFIGYIIADKAKHGYKFKPCTMGCLFLFSSGAVVVDWYFTQEITVTNMMLFCVFMSSILLIISIESTNISVNVSVRHISTLIFCGHPWVIVVVQHIPVFRHSFIVQCIAVLFFTSLFAVIFEFLSRKIMKLQWLKNLY